MSLWPNGNLMNLTDYTYLLNKPDAINDRYAATLDNVLSAFPYFQSARVLKLKHLYNQDSFNYNYALKVSAAFTTDRSLPILSIISIFIVVMFLSVFL